jgi:hypothetical protein
VVEAQEQYIVCVESLNVGWTRQGEYEVEYDDQDAEVCPFSCMLLYLLGPVHIT